MSLTHITEKSHTVEGVIQNCIFVSTNNILSKIKKKTLLNIYKSSLIPTLTYGCEIWIPITEDISKLIQIQLLAISRLLKIPTLTPLVSIVLETTELPIILEFKKRQLTYLWVLRSSENQTKDILDIQLKEYKYFEFIFTFKHVFCLPKKLQ